jgi:hypothetical protein
MEIYRLTSLGEMLSHNTRPPKDSVKWKVIYYLSRGAKEKSEILTNTGATSYTLSYLKMKNIIVGSDSPL